jgi:hypothetical protein
VSQPAAHGRQPKPFSFAYAGQAISLGRHDAIGFNTYPDDRAEIAEVNGQPAAIVRVGQHVMLIIAVDVDHEHVREIHVIGNPDKLSRV